MSHRFRSVAIAITAAALTAFSAGDALAQALTSLASLRVGYNTRKATAVPRAS